MASKIGKGEWVCAYAVAGIIDALQWLSDLTGVGAAVNEAADPFIGAAIAAYFQLRGVSMITDLKRLGSLIGAVGLEEITLSVAPAWIVDVWYIHRTVKQEEAAARAAQAQGAAAQDQARNPAYRNGRREPAQEEGDSSHDRHSRPAVIDGMRAPRQDA